MSSWWGWRGRYDVRLLHNVASNWTGAGLLTMVQKYSHAIDPHQKIDIYDSNSFRYFKYLDELSSGFRLNRGCFVCAVLLLGAR
jgi:hypothetical protein